MNQMGEGLVLCTTSIFVLFKQEELYRSYVIYEILHILIIHRALLNRYPGTRRSSATDKGIFLDTLEVRTEQRNADFTRNNTEQGLGGQSFTNRGEENIYKRCPHFKVPENLPSICWERFTQADPPPFLEPGFIRTPSRGGNQRGLFTTTHPQAEKFPAHSGRIPQHRNPKLTGRENELRRVQLHLFVQEICYWGIHCGIEDFGFFLGFYQVQH